MHSENARDTFSGVSLRISTRFWIGQVRHPNVLAFLHSTEVENIDGGVAKPTIYLVTEPVMPLSEKIQELDLQGTQRYSLLLNPMLNVIKS